MFDWVYKFSQDFAAWFVKLFADLLGKLIALLLDVFMWVLDFLGPIVRIALLQLSVGVSGILAQVPVPSFVFDFQSKWDAVPWSTIGFFLAPFQVEYGFTVVFAATLLRFVLRIVPFIGRMWR